MYVNYKNNELALEYLKLMFELVELVELVEPVDVYGDIARRDADFSEISTFM